MTRSLPCAVALVLSLGGRTGAAPTDPATTDPAAADTTDARWALPTVHITADPLPDAAGPLPLTTTRLGPEAIARRPGGDVADLLETVAGVRVTRRGGAADAGISIRGATTEQVLVLVDGHRWRSAQDGGVDVGSLPLDAVESVDVLRGGASALWGEGALAGAIHVHTRSPRPGEAHLRVAGGSYGQRSVSGATAWAVGPRWRTRITGRHFATNGDYSFLDDHRGGELSIRNGDVRRDGGSARLEGPLGAAGRLRFDLSASQAERGVPGSEEFPSPTARLHDGELAASARWTWAGAPHWQPGLDLSWLSRTRRYHEPEAPFGPIDERHVNDHVRAEGTVDAASGRFAMRAAAGATLDALHSTTDGDRRRDSFDVRLRASAALRRGTRACRATFAIRRDDVEGFAPAWSPRLGVLATLWPGRATMHASAGTSHRTPSFDELFYPARASAAGNPDLEPERGRDADAGLALDGLPLDGRLATDVFVREVRELIQWIPGAGGVWRPHNVGRAVLAGVEWSATASPAKWSSGALELEVAATRLFSEDRSGDANADGRELAYRPHWTADGRVRVRGAIGGELEADLKVVDAVYVTRANTKTLPGYALVDLRYRRPIAADLVIDLAATNLRDETARDFRDYPLPGRSFELGVTYRRSAS